MDLAIVEAGTGDHTAAHEFGHLFGAGHIDSSDTWLEEFSHALFFPYYSGSRNVTAVAERNNDNCSETTIQCNYMPFFSGPGNIGGGSNNNAATLDITALSVANYVTGAGPGSGAPPSGGSMCADGFDNDNDGFVDMNDPGCTSTNDDNESDDPPPADAGQGCSPVNYVPVNVTATLIEVCVPGTSKSRYRVRWDHACPNLFQIRAAPSGLPPYLVTETYMQSIDLVIEGPPVTALVDVRACETSVWCSAFSQNVLLVDGC